MEMKQLGPRFGEKTRREIEEMRNKIVLCADINRCAHLVREWNKNHLGPSLAFWRVKGLPEFQEKCSLREEAWTECGNLIQGFVWTAKGWRQSSECGAATHVQQFSMLKALGIVIRSQRKTKKQRKKCLLMPVMSSLLHLWHAPAGR